MMSLVEMAKNTFLPKGGNFRKVPFGLAAGCCLKIDFQHQLRVYLGTYEFELNRCFRAMVHANGKCFDVGGNNGYHALVCAKLSGVPVLTFECDGDVVTAMKEVFERNPYDIEVIEGFVGNNRSSRDISLDEVAETHSYPDFIKLDIEGGESEALTGASGTSARMW